MARRPIAAGAIGTASSVEAADAFRVHLTQASGAYWRELRV